MNIPSLLSHLSAYETSYSTTDPAVTASIIGFLLLFSLFVALLTYVIYAWSLSRIFKKAGIEEWKAWIPVYNNWVLLEMGGQQGYWAVLAFIPIVSIAAMVFMFIAMYNIGLKLGKDGTFVLLAIFLPIIWCVWLALDSSKWRGAHPDIAPVSKK